MAEQRYTRQRYVRSRPPCCASESIHPQFRYALPAFRDILAMYFWSPEMHVSVLSCLTLAVYVSRSIVSQATLGGMVSQELIKVLTTQFVPVDAGFLVNLLDNTATRIPV